MPHADSVLLLMITAHKTGWPGPGPVTTASIQLDLPSHTLSSMTDACQACGGGGVTLQSWVDVTCISKQYQVSSQSCVGFLAGDWDGECNGVLPNASGSSGPFQLLGVVRLWPSVWILTPGFWSSKSLNLAAIDMKTGAVNWNSG